MTANNLVTKYDFEQCKPLMVEVIDLLRSRNVSYETARFVLECAQDILQQVMKSELQNLPLADGIDYERNPNRLMLFFKRSQNETDVSQNP